VSSLAYFRANRGFLMIMLLSIWLYVSLPSSELADPSSSTWMSKVKVDPMSTSDSTLIVPLSYCMIILEMLSPKPIPPRLRCLLDVTRPKNWKSFLISSAFIPMPVSETVVLRIGFFVIVSSVRKSRVIVMAPLNVNFTALPKRLNSTCLNRFESDFS
jgi:hypothetical protein